MQANEEKDLVESPMSEMDSFVVIPDENSRGISSSNQTLRGESTVERSSNGLATNSGKTPEHRVSDSTLKPDQSAFEKREEGADTSNPPNTGPIFMAQESLISRSGLSTEDRVTSRNCEAQDFGKNDCSTRHRESTYVTSKSESFLSSVQRGVELESFARDSMHMEDTLKIQGNNVSSVVHSELNSVFRERSDLSTFKNIPSAISLMHVEEISKQDIRGKDSKHDSLNKEESMLQGVSKTLSQSIRSDPPAKDRCSPSMQIEEISKRMGNIRGKESPYDSSNKEESTFQEFSKTSSRGNRSGLPAKDHYSPSMQIEEISKHDIRGKDLRHDSSHKEGSVLQLSPKTSSAATRSDPPAKDRYSPSVQTEEISKHDIRGKESSYDSANKDESTFQESTKTSSPGPLAKDHYSSSAQREEISKHNIRGKDSRHDSPSIQESMPRSFPKSRAVRSDPPAKDPPPPSASNDRPVPRDFDEASGSIDKTSRIAEAEVHASLERAIRSMRYEPVDLPATPATDECIDVKNQITPSRRRISDPSTTTDTVTGIMHAARRREESDEPPENLAADQSVEEEERIEAGDEGGRRDDLTIGEVESGLEKEGRSRGWSSLEDLKERSRRTWGRKAPRVRLAEGVSSKKIAKGKEKKTMGSLRSSLGKKVGSMEKMLEDRMERLWEENVEKHPWLLPIETWIVDRCKSSGAYSLGQPDEDRALGMEARPKSREEVARLEAGKERRLEFKFTAAEGEDEEPRIESRVVEHGKGADGADGADGEGSTRLERSSLDRTSFISRLRKVDGLSQRQENADNASGSNEDRGILEVKDVKQSSHDLLDKLRDNVRGKMEDIHRYFQRTNRLADVNRRLKSQIWSSVVTIVLVEAKNLLPMDIDGLSDPYVKFRLGTEKYKSKVINKTLNPVWLEQFDLHLYEDPYLGQELEVTVWDRDRSHQDDIMGRTVINLATLERETTHRLWRELEDGSGNIFLLLTISGTTASETISDLAAHEETPQERVHLYQRYAICNTLQRVRDVGHLTVKVYRAQGLAAADLGGKSDPFCVLELVNARLQTQTEYKTLAPNWQKIFTFNVKDINSVLEVTVYDEDRDHKVEFLGKVAIPLLRMRNGEKRWYALKDKKLRGRAKGNSPQILLEMNVVWNVIRACIRTLNPKEKKYMEPEVKFKRQVFLRNVLRLKAIIVIFIDIGKYIQSCWEWENKMRSIIALILFILGCYYFEPYMIPAAALLILLKYYLLSGDGSGFNQWVYGQVAVLTGAPLTHHTSPHLQDPGDGASDDCPVTPGDDDDDEDDKDKEEKKSLKERLQAIQEVTQTVQNSIGYIASLCEKVKNLFNFTVPYLSCLAMMLTILGVAVLYFIPVRYMILAWGVNKFSRKIVRPHSVPNNEVLDLISRVPDDEELLNYRELKPLPTADCERGGVSGSPGTSNVTRREQRKRHKAA